MLRLGDINGSPYIGVYCAASEDIAVVAETTDPKVVKELSQTLGVKIVRSTIAGGTIVGSLVAMNSYGVIVTNFAEQHEVARFPKGLRIAKMEEKFNAAGNNILVNDEAALVNPGVSDKTVRRLQDVLGVEVQRGKLAGIETVGSVGIATAKGLVCHPRTTEEELKWLSGLFKVPATVATLNYGTPYLGACAVANSKGAYVGSKSTPIELGRLEDGLVLF